MSDQTTHLDLPFIMANQAQKHVTHNAALAMLDNLVQLSVLDRAVNTPAVSPDEGDRYIVGSSPTGAWSGWAKSVAAWVDGAWLQLVPGEGWLAWVEDEARVYVYTGSDWAEFLVTMGAGIESALEARTAAQRSAHLAAMGSGFSLAQKQAVQDALINPPVFGVLAADYTLTSTTSLQKLFDWSANGAASLETGTWRFECGVWITGMDAASGNGQFSLLGAGTATLAKILMNTVGSDSLGLNSNAAVSGHFSTTGTTNASMVTAGVNTNLGATVRGVFDVTGAGTLIPSMALVTAIAAVVKAGSYFIAQRIGVSGAVTGGTWS